MRNLSNDFFPDFGIAADVLGIQRVEHQAGGLARSLWQVTQYLFRSTPRASTPAGAVVLAERPDVRAVFASSGPLWPSGCRRRRPAPESRTRLRQRHTQLSRPSTPRSFSLSPTDPS